MVMVMEKQGRKRSRPPATAAAADGCATRTGHGGDEKLSKRQWQAVVAAKPPYHAPKSTASSLQRTLDDVPAERWTPQQRVDLIADLSESILEDPSSALTSSRAEVSSGGGGKTSRVKKNEDVNPDKKDPQYHKTQSKVNALLDLAFPSRNGHDAHAARLALLSLLAIFQDILPSYRLRLPTETEMNVRVSKDVKATWDYERKLLQAYQRYLQLLERTWEDGKFGRRWSADGKKSGKNEGGGPPTTLAATAILSLSTLLKTCYNFNFRTNLLQIVVRQANHRSSEEVRSACCDALSTMFVRDAKGDASLEAVRLMAKTIKQKSANNNNGRSIVRPELLNTWLSLPLRVHEDEAAAARLVSAAKAKCAKRSQAEKDAQHIEREMREGEATMDKAELARNQADCLHAVTLTYFRILKLVANDGDSNGNKKAGGGSATALELLPCALRGLAKFSHLIHADAVVDLLAVLKDLLKKSVSRLPPEAAMHCVLCALRTLKGPGREAVLPVDPKEYLMPLYNLLPRVGVARMEPGTKNNTSDVAPGPDETVEAALQCLDHAFLQRRELSTSRLAAFLKRIASTALHCPPHSAGPLLMSARQISSRYKSPRVERMLENEEDVVTEGSGFAPDAKDPEHANAHAGSLWELGLLRHSVHPGLAEITACMAEGRPPRLPGEAPARVWEGMGRDVREAYIPHRVVWKKHPLDNGFQSSEEGGVAKDGDRRRKSLYDAAAAENISRKKRRQQQRNRNQVRFITPRRTENWHLLPATSYSML